MRIAVNTRLLLSGHLDGIGWFTYETLRRIVQAHPEHEFIFLFDRKPSSEFLFADNVKPVVLFPQARHPLLWYLFFEWSVPYAVRKYKCDLFVSPDGWMPLHLKVPTLTVIHDLNFEHSDGNLRLSHQIYMKHYFPQFAKRATRVATVSQFSKNDICATYSIPEDKIDVVYDGAHDIYRPLGEEADARTREQYTGGVPYFIFISTILKRKNLANLLLAFDSFKKKENMPYKLVVVGRRVWWQDELREAYNSMQHASDVVFVEHVGAQELLRLLSAATALAYVSKFEGFGIPIMESFHADTPVITSNVTSMPEVAGDAAWLVDPASVEHITQALCTLATQPAVCQDLIERGRARRELFSWDKTADLLWKSMQKTLS